MEAMKSAIWNISLCKRSENVLNHMVPSIRFSWRLPSSYLSSFFSCSFFLYPANKSETFLINARKSSLVAILSISRPQIWRQLTSTALSAVWNGVHPEASTTVRVRVGWAFQLQLRQLAASLCTVYRNWMVMTNLGEILEGNFRLNNFQQVLLNTLAESANISVFRFSNRIACPEPNLILCVTCDNVQCTRVVWLRKKEKG